MEMGLAKLGRLWGLGWSGAWHRWGRFGAGLDQAQLRPCLGPDEREPRHSLGLAA